MLNENPAVDRGAEDMARDMLESFWRRVYGNLTANGAPDALAADALMMVALEKRCAVEGPIALAKALTVAASGLVAMTTGVVMSDHVDGRDQSGTNGLN